MLKRILQKIRARRWFRDNAETTLRLNYDLNESSTVFDLGGYEGQWTGDIYAKYHCTVHVFEPVASFYEKIRERFKNNQNISLYKYGLSGSNRIDKISINKNSSSIYRTVGKNFEDVEIRDVVEFFSQHAITKVDLMKINIEGGEYELLERIIESGLVRKINNLQIQFHDFFPGARKRMKNIQSSLLKTHHLTYQYPFVWENWELNNV